MENFFLVHLEIDLNGMENNVGEDSDSIGNTRNTRSGFTLPAKEKRKPFFKKVGLQNCASHYNLQFHLCDF